MLRDEEPCDEQARMPFEPGTIVDERYQVLEHLGEGGMGNVFKAVELELDRVVALKVLHHGLLMDRESQSRFIREGKILSSESNPHVVRFYRFGLWEQIPFIVMEYLQGKSLSMLIHEEKRLNPDRCIALMAQVCEAMVAMHEHGIMHRDLKPSNIMVLNAPEPDFVKIVDFGLARFLQGSNASQTLTRTGMLIGSPHYMSPEQCQGSKLDHRSDIYSVGCVFYEALTGQPPLAADNPIGLVFKHVHELPRPLLEFFNDSELPEGLNSCIFKSMAKDRQKRYQSMKQLACDLELVRQGRASEITPYCTAYPLGIKNSAKRGLTKPMLAVLALVVFLLASVCMVSRQPPLRDADERQQSVSRPENWVKHHKNLPAIEFVSEIFPDPHDRIALYRGWLATYGATAAKSMVADAEFNLGEELISSGTIDAEALQHQSMAKNYYLHRLDIKSIPPEGYDDLLLAYERLSVIYIMANELKRAREVLTEGLARCGRYSSQLMQCRVHDRLIQISLREGNDKDAELHFRKLLQIRDSPTKIRGEFLIDFAQVLQRQGKLAEARDTTQAAIELYKVHEGYQSVPWTLHLGQQLQAENRYDEALNLYKEVVNVQSDNESMRLNTAMATCLGKLGRYRQAHERWLKVIYGIPKADCTNFCKSLLAIIENAAIGRLYDVDLAALVDDYVKRCAVQDSSSTTLAGLNLILEQFKNFGNIKEERKTLLNCIAICDSCPDRQLGAIIPDELKYANVLCDTGELKGAEDFLRRMLNRTRILKSEGMDIPLRIALVEILVQSKIPPVTEAENVIEPAFRPAEAMQDSKPEVLANLWRIRGDIYYHGNPRKAEMAYLQALSIMDKHPTRVEPSMRSALLRKYAKLCESLGRRDYGKILRSEVAKEEQSQKRVPPANSKP